MDTKKIGLYSSGVTIYHDLKEKRIIIEYDDSINDTRKIIDKRFETVLDANISCICDFLRTQLIKRA